MLDDPRSTGLQIRIYAIYCFAKFVGAATLLMILANEIKVDIEEYQSDYQNCQMCLKQSEKNPNTLYEFARCQYFYPMDDDYREDALLFSSIRGKEVKNLTIDELKKFKSYLEKVKNPERKTEESNRVYTPKQFEDSHSNLLLHRGLFDTPIQSQVVSLTSIAVVLFFAIIVLSLFYMWLACILVADDVEDRGHTLTLFMAINLVVIVLLLELANNIWLLYFENGCWISVVSWPYLVISQMLMTLFLVLLCLAQCPFSCNHFIVSFSGAVLFMYTLLSVVMACINYSVSHRIFVFIFVLLGFLSIFEIPSFLFGLAFYKDVFRFISVPLCNVPEIRTNVNRYPIRYDQEQ